MNHISNSQEIMASSIRPEIQARMGLANAASLLPAQVTLNPKIRYAVLFNEGPGYLLIDDLGSGANASTMLVSSMEDHQTYVRKLHNPTEFSFNTPFDCPDVSNIPDQSHVPRLLSFSHYSQPITVQIREVTFATIWQLCNGGTFSDFLETWLHGDNATHRFPEAFVWHFLTTLCETFIEIFQQGVVHRDVHAGNLVLHWPQNTPLPELFLIDFGNGARYPQVGDLDFRAPWTGNFDETGNPISDKLSRHESHDILNWYAAAFTDMQTAMELLSAIQIRQSNGADGPSPEMVRTITAWNNFLEYAYMQPSKALAGLITLLSETRAQSNTIVRQFLARPRHAYRSIRWMRNVESRTQPALWKDPSRLFTHSEYSADEVLIQGGGMQGSVDLAEGQFRVVQVTFDQNTLQLRVNKVVNSIADVDNLSPDDNTQFDWRQFDNNARRIQHDVDSSDDEDDEEDRPVPRARHIPTPFIQQWSELQPSSASSEHQPPSRTGNLEATNNDRQRRAFQAQLETHRQFGQADANTRRHEDELDGFNDNVVSQRQRDLEARLASGPPRTQLRLAPLIRVDSEDFDNDPIAQRRRDYQAQRAARQPDPRLRSRSPRFDSPGNDPRTQQRVDYQAQLEARRPDHQRTTDARRQPSHEDDSDDCEYDNDPISQRRRVYQERLDARQRNTTTRRHENNSDSEEFDNDPIAQRRRVHQERLEARQRRAQRDR